MDEFSRWAGVVDAKGIARVKEAAVRDMFGDAGFYAMTVGDFTTVLLGDDRPLYQSGGRTAFDRYRVEAFREWMDTVCATLKGLTLPPDPRHPALTSGTRPSTFEESVYVFCRSYFGLPGFAEVDRLPVSDYILARKDDYNRAVIERNRSRA